MGWWSSKTSSLKRKRSPTSSAAPAIRSGTKRLTNFKIPTVIAPE